MLDHRGQQVTISQRPLADGVLIESEQVVVMASLPFRRGFVRRPVELAVQDGRLLPESPLGAQRTHAAARLAKLLRQGVGGIGSNLTLLRWPMVRACPEFQQDLASHIAACRLQVGCDARWVDEDDGLRIGIVRVEG